MKTIKKSFAFTFVVLALALLSCLLFNESQCQAATPSISKTTLKIKLGEKKTLTVSGASGTKWKSSKKSVVKVSKKGVLTPVKEGKATITAKTGSYKLKCKVTVKGKITDASYVKKMIKIINKERSKRGKRKLKVSLPLTQAANARAKEITELFSHTRPNNSSSFSILKEYGVSYMSSGENIAMGQRTPKEVMTAWMNSEGHKRNILNGVFGKVGLGRCKYQGRYYWVQMFTD